MPPEIDLFGEVPPAPAAQLKVVKTKAKLSPAQQRFNKLLSRVDNLTAQTQHLHTMADRFRPAHLQTMAELEKQTTSLQKDMLLFLHERLQRKGLTAPQQKTVRSIVKDLLEILEPEDDPQVMALFDTYYTPEEQAQTDLADTQAKQELKDLLEQMAGRPLDDLNTDLSAEEMLHAAMGEMRKAAESAAEQAPARKSKRPPTARQRAAEQQEMDAKTTLRTIFRQLASALHPDREPDTAERARKTALMSEVNAAYERNDLMTLLRLQMQIAQLDANSIASMADDKLAAMSLLLKEQVRALEEDVEMMLHRIRGEMGIMVSPNSPDTVWARQILEIQQDMQETIEAMQEDLARVQDDAELKRWAKAQNQMAKQIAMEHANAMPFFF